MRRHRFSLALLLAVMLPLGACVLLVPYARIPPGPATTAPLDLSDVAARDPGVAIELHGADAEQVLAQVRTSTAATQVAADVLSRTGRVTALRLVNQALATDSGAGAVTDLGQVVLQSDGSIVVVLGGAASGDGQAGTVVQLPSGTVPSLLSDAGARLRALAMTRVTSTAIVTTGATPTPAATTAPPTPSPAPQTPAAAVPAAPAAAPAPTAPDCAVTPCVALTFDDGPGTYTAALLDALAARGAPATFFLVGRNIAKYPAVVAREVAEGHAVGNHTWDHAWLTKLSPEDVGAELDETSAAIQAAAGVSTALVRPPYGAFDDASLAVLAARGDAAICWSVDTEDWKNRDAAVTTQRALEGAAPGAIILMHDIHESTLTAIPGIIDGLRAAGYTLVTVPQLLGTTAPGQAYRHR
ncbi:MAG: polysaccharide deacetylase family protein [Actinobacteria bacterium]|nr:polysaccharide deacetylase family protein [Actinomycetota bacterium]